VQHSTDREPGISQNPRFTDRSGSGNPDHRVNHPDVLRKEEEPLRDKEQVKKHVVMWDHGHARCRPWYTSMDNVLASRFGMTRQGDGSGIRR
jgi:hypothetical protein